MLNLIFLNILLLFSSCSSADKSEARANGKQILVFYKTAGFYHNSIPAGLAALQKLGRENNFRVDTSNKAENFTPANLKNYAAVVFLNTTQDVLNDEQQLAFENYIKSGKGFVGIHAASDTEYDWPWYNKLVGAYFASHPHVQKATIEVTDKKHPATSFLPSSWEHTDEWYNFKDIYPGIKVLASLDETSYEGGKNNGNHPIAWYHEFDGGRAFYTGLGHTDETYSDPLFLKHLLGGIKYAIGK